MREMDVCCSEDMEQVQRLLENVYTSMQSNSLGKDDVYFSLQWWITAKDRNNKKYWPTGTSYARLKESEATFFISMIPNLSNCIRPYFVNIQIQTSLFLANIEERPIIPRVKKIIKIQVKDSYLVITSYFFIWPFSSTEVVCFPFPWGKLIA